jgi:hypothetical protein
MGGSVLVNNPTPSAGLISLPEQFLFTRRVHAGYDFAWRCRPASGYLWGYACFGLRATLDSPTLCPLRLKFNRSRLAKLAKHAQAVRFSLFNSLSQLTLKEGDQARSCTRRMLSCVF